MKIKCLVHLIFVFFLLVCDSVLNVNFYTVYLIYARRHYYYYYYYILIHHYPPFLSKIKQIFDGK